VDLLAPVDIEDSVRGLDLGRGWPERWSVTWRSAAGGDVCQRVDELVRGGLKDPGPMRAFTWRREQRHRPGLPFVQSTGRLHGAESLEESRFLLALDFAGEVTEIVSQPLRLRFGGEPGMRVHTPDYLVRTGSGVGDLKRAIEGNELAVLVLGPLFLWSQRWQKARGRDPLLPPGLWADRGFRLSLVLDGLLFGGIVGFYLYYALVLESGYHLSALVTALTTLPSAGAALVVSVLSGRIVRRWGGRRVVAVGAIVSSLGFLSVLAPVMVVRNGTLGWWTAPSQLVFGAGLGLVVAPVLSVVLESIRSAEAGAASGLLSTAQSIAGAIAVVVMGMLFETQIPGSLGAATADQLSSGFACALAFNPVIYALALVILALLPRAVSPDDSGHRKDR
jgi:hypothetical protein